jgi:Uma2 family endonuclease
MLHRAQCAALYQALRRVLGDGHSAGSDNFVYFDGADPRRVLAPDAFAKFGRSHVLQRTWKTWVDGTPELAFEIFSPSNTREHWSLEEKIRRYHALGVRELVVFDADASVGKRLRVWDRLEDDFVERVVESERTPCLHLDLHLLLAPADVEEHLPVALRLARDPDGRDLIPTTEEERARAEQERARAEQERARAEQERARAEQEREQADARRDAEKAERLRAEADLASARARIAELEAAARRG